MLNIKDTVYFLQDGLWEEAEVFMFGGENQVLLDCGGTWVLKNVSEVKTAKDMTAEDWKHYNFN